MLKTICQPFIFMTLFIKANVVISMPTSYMSKVFYKENFIQIYKTIFFSDCSPYTTYLLFPLWQTPELEWGKM